MSSARTHPRRRPLKASSPQVAPLSTHSMQLRKSTTFSSPTSISSDVCDLDNSPFMPRRSPTSTDSLEELVHDAGIQRVANILKDLDKRIAGHKSAFKSSTDILQDREVLPLPSFILDNTSLEDTLMDIDSKSAAEERNPHDHASDSGLGSSISGSKEDESRTLCSSARGSISTSVTSSHSAITRSFSTLGVSEEKHTLGEYACNQIHDLIIKPILAEESLKDFHPLIKDVPRRIGEKNISNLRDLEKTLIFLAPEFSATPKSYQHFCERAIRALSVTVNHLSEQDQRLPTDRPYTNNYFLDLIEQIRRYAAIMAATRQKESNGEELDDMDYSPDEKITLRGGLSHNGRPAELVREKNGKVIPIAEGGLSEEDYASSTKRALSDDEQTDDEGVKRSMARRRKSDKPGDVLHACRDCKKEFKRPCDLTKHEKTHSRPWKCSEEKCKYFELGWPTEKERDRHMNDKHSAAPPQYKCMYPPCTYASKRESNCKQHMEKAHGWEYVRSKSNGRKKGPTAGSERSPQTPLTPLLGTPASAFAATPMTPFLQSPAVPVHNEFDYPYGFGTPALSMNGFQDDFRRDSVTTDGSVLTYSSGHSPTEPNYVADAVTPEDTAINHDIVFDCAMNGTMGNVFQQPTPAMTAFDTLDGIDFTRPFPINTTATAPAIVPHLSPGAQPDVTLFSPAMHLDEGFSENMAMFNQPTADFTLFPESMNNNTGFTGNTTDFFPDITQLGGQFDGSDNQHLFMEQQAITNTFNDLMHNAFQGH